MGGPAVAGAGDRDGGNHFTRDQPSIRLAPDRFEASLLEADSIFGRFAPVRWARPSSGWYTERTVAIMRRHGYRCALASVYPYDAILPWSRFAAGRRLGCCPLAACGPTQRKPQPGEDADDASQR